MLWVTFKRLWLLACILLAGLTLLAAGWVWCFWRVEVPPGYSLVRFHLWGKDLPEDEILATNESYKGVMAEMLPEGRYFLNPFEWRTELVPMVEVPAGKVLVQTRLYGKRISDARLATGDFLARDDERGVVGDVLRPGKYRLNPYAYRWQEFPVVEVKAGEVGVCTLKIGTDPTDVKGGGPSNVYVVPEGTRGVQKTYLPSGTYYVNPYVKDIVAVDTRSHPVEFTDIEFPSKDGFKIKLHVTVTYKVQEAKAPELFVMLSNDGRLPQGYKMPEEMAANPILQKVVLPLIRGQVRLEGSSMSARDFVAQSSRAAEADKDNPRERLQKRLMKDAEDSDCKKLGIVIESINVGQTEMDADLKALAEQIAARELARLEDEKNKSLIEQHKQQQELKAKEALKQQEAEKVKAQTQLDVAEIEAHQRLEVQKAKLEKDKEAANILLSAALKEAQSVKALGEADAKLIDKQNEAEVAALKTAVRGFSSPEQYAQYQVLLRLAPALKEVFASDTGDFARLFAAYMTPPAKSAPPPGTGGPDAARVMPPAGK
jgi:hypothetical protein